MKNTHKPLPKNIERFIACNEAMRLATLKSEREFLQEAGNMSNAQLHIILSVFQRKMCTMSELASMLHFTRGNVTQLVDKLVANKFVKRIRSEEDRRLVSITLLEKGNRIAQLHLEHVKRVGADWFKHMAAEEQDVMLSCWEKYLSLGAE